MGEGWNCERKELGVDSPSRSGLRQFLEGRGLGGFINLKEGIGERERGRVCLGRWVRGEVHLMSGPWYGNRVGPTCLVCL